MVPCLIELAGVNLLTHPRDVVALASVMWEKGYADLLRETPVNCGFLAYRTPVLFPTLRTVMKRTALYLRVSTGEQTIENQRRELTETAERHGWCIVAEYSDVGISGAKGRDRRPGLDGLCKAITRREVDLVAAWSVDRLGRSLQHLITFLGELHASGCDLYLHRQGLDTGTPAGRALFGMMGVFAEFERAMIAERVRAGMGRAKAAGKRIGRPKLDIETRRKIAQNLAQGATAYAVAKGLGIDRHTVLKYAGAMTE
jgi:DNA invertase Pin-like site-specific DNA recombinase